MNKDIGDRIWEVGFVVTLASLVATVVLIPLWTVFAIPYGIITDNDNFILGGGMGIFPGMTIVAWAACALSSGP